MKSEVFLLDCMEGMKQYPDKYFDLAVVDPPYGIGAGGVDFKNGSSKTIKSYFRENDWDKEPPNDEYFKELFRISKHQIIWGGNYFTQLWSKPCRAYIIWDKTIHGNSYADCEFAWTSYDLVARYFRENICQTTKEGRIHPTQKSIKLYSWIYSKYLPQGGKVLDNHLGSGSNRIAADKAGNIEFTAFEIDKDYFEAQEERFRLYKSQLKLPI